MNTTAAKLLYIILGATAVGMGAPPAAAQAGLGPVNRTIDRTLGQRLPRPDTRLDTELRRKAEEAEGAAREAADTSQAAGDELLPAVTPDAEGLINAAGETAGTLVNDVSSTVQNAAGSLRPFVTDVDPFGNAIEQNTLVVLLERDQLAALRARGLTVISEQDMPGLGLVLLTLRAPQAYGLADKKLELEQAFPGAVVDYNHLYYFQRDEDASNDPRDQTQAGATADQTAAGAASPDIAQALPGSGVDNKALRIGLIDSAVLPAHASLKSVSITAQDFARHAGERPVGHGTAVASVIARAGVAPIAVYSAGVFFQSPGHAPGASTESLVAALDWLAAEEVDAINMSLAGPANALLERALTRLAATAGPPVIAAVGNNGPSGEPMYPGAYDTVVGVTAVDRKQKVFRYANRGEHVDFAALGVDVKVANAAGGWRLESGTSMAAPRIAVIVGALRQDTAASGPALHALLVSYARDLGRPGFDPVFGHGLLTEPPDLQSRLKTLPQD